MTHKPTRLTPVTPATHGRDAYEWLLAEAMLTQRSPRQIYLFICANCERPFMGKGDAVTCSARCRQARRRRLARQAGSEPS